MSSDLVTTELVKTTTSDGLRLDGVLQQPSEPRGDARPAILCLHGAGSNFYAGGLFEHLSATMSAAGWRVLRVNTRGHDGMYTGRTAAGTQRFGAAYERVADCCLDIAAWVDWLVKNSGAPSVVLVGHSLGAIKAVYAEAEQPSQRVAAVIAISPPRLSRTALQWGSRGEAFQATLLEAESRVAAGRGRELLESTFPFPMLITAESFIDKYGADRYNVVQLAPRVAAPLRFIFGQLELEYGGVAFAGVPEAIMAARRPEQDVTLQTIAGADHFYVGCYDALAQAVCGFMPDGDG